MRFLRPFVAIAVFLCTAAAQDLAQSVDLIQRIDTLYPWLPGGNLAIDVHGNIYVSASIQSSLPDAITNRIGPLTPANNTYRYNIVIVKLDPTGQHILYGTAIGGSNGNDAGRIQVDADGNAYASGSTISDDFPAASFLGASHRGSVFFKLDPNGKLVFSVVLGWAHLHLGGAEIDATGAIYISGGIRPGELSTSPSAFDPTPLDSRPRGRVHRQTGPFRYARGSCYLCSGHCSVQSQVAPERRRSLFCRRNVRGPGCLAFYTALLHSD